MGNGRVAALGARCSDLGVGGRGAEPLEWVGRSVAWGVWTDGIELGPFASHLFCLSCTIDSLGFFEGRVRWELHILVAGCVVRWKFVQRAGLAADNQSYRRISKGRGKRGEGDSATKREDTSFIRVQPFRKTERRK